MTPELPPLPQASEPLACEDADALVDGLRDGWLEPAQRAALEEHLEACASCRATLESIDRIGSTARALGDHAAARVDWGALRTRIEPVAAPAPAVARPVASPRRTPSWRHAAIAAAPPLTPGRLAAASVALAAAATLAGFAIAWRVDAPARPAAPARVARDDASSAPRTGPRDERAPDRTDDLAASHAPRPIDPIDEPTATPRDAASPSATDDAGSPTAPPADAPTTTEPEAPAPPTRTAPPSTTTDATTTTADASPPATARRDRLLARLDALAAIEGAAAARARGEMPIPEDDGSGSPTPVGPAASLAAPSFATGDVPDLEALLSERLPAKLRKRVARTLAELDGDRARAALERVLRGADDADARATAAWALAVRSDPEARDALARAAEADPSPYVRNAARAALSNVPTRRRSR